MGLKDDEKGFYYKLEIIVCMLAPEDGAEVLATDGDGIWLCYKTTMSDGSPWFQPDGLPHIEGVTHWIPLPAAPKEGK